MTDVYWVAKCYSLIWVTVQSSACHGNGTVVPDGTGEKKLLSFSKGSICGSRCLLALPSIKNSSAGSRESSYCWIFIGSLIICYKAAKHGIPNSMNSIMNGLFILLISLY